MFEKPQPIPSGTNHLLLILTYVVNDDENKTKKARATCNGDPHMKGTVTMGHTYTDSLDHTASRIFWSIPAAKDRIVFGVDGYNSFAEILPPKDPLYIIIDQQYHDWYRHTNNMSIPEDYGINVNRALQGHPEYPRVLATLINKHITALDFKPCFHEPYLYYHPNYNGKEVYFLR